MIAPDRDQAEAQHQDVQVYGGFNPEITFERQMHEYQCRNSTHEITALAIGIDRLSVLMIYSQDTSYGFRHRRLGEAR